MIRLIISQADTTVITINGFSEVNHLEMFLELVSASVHYYLCEQGSAGP